MASENIRYLPAFLAHMPDKDVAFLSDFRHIVVCHEFPCQAQCIPTWQCGADGSMWLECQHLRYLVER